MRGRGALVLGLLALWGCGRSASPPADGPDILLIVLDTLRRDRVSAYGDAQHATPHLDAFAAGGLRFDRAFANSGWTLPSHASLFTGRYPVAHRATQESLRLDDTAVTLAEILRDTGYRTFAASGNAVVSPDNGLLQGFQEVVESYRPAVARELGGVHPNVAALDRFYGAAGNAPTFAFLNFIEPHLPYTPPDPFRTTALGPDPDLRVLGQAARTRMRQHYLSQRTTPPAVLEMLGRLYDGEALYTDWLVGRVLEVLATHGRARDTLVVITSDHGENLGEHGHLAHVFSLHNTLLHVPLLVRWPGRIGPGTRADVVQLLDLFPTLLAVAGIDAPDHHGRDLLASDAAEVDGLAFAEYYYPRQVFSVFSEEELDLLREGFVPYMLRRRTVQDAGGKLHRTSRDGEAWYDLVADPHEENPLARGNPRLSTALADFVQRYQGEPPLPPPPPLGWRTPGFEGELDDPELLERLKALGYVE